MYHLFVAVSEPLNLALAGWLTRTKAIDRFQGRRDRNNPMVAIWIGFPPSDRAVCDKNVDPEPRDELEASCFRAVHVIPGNLHLVCPVDLPPVATLLISSMADRRG
jgi:hypothetical protein